MSKMKFDWLHIPLIIFLMYLPTVLAPVIRDVSQMLTTPKQQNQNGMQQMRSRSYPSCIVYEFEPDLCQEGNMKCDSRTSGCCPCPEGTYMPAKTFNSCNRCLNNTNCEAAGQKIKTPGNITHDTICEDFTPTEGTGSSTPSPVPTLEIPSSTKDTSEVTTTVVGTPVQRLHPYTATVILAILLVVAVITIVGLIWKPSLPKKLHDVVRDLCPARFRGESSSEKAKDGNEVEKEELVEEIGYNSTHGEAEVGDKPCPEDTSSESVS